MLSACHAAAAPRPASGPATPPVRLCTPGSAWRIMRSPAAVQRPLPLTTAAATRRGGPTGRRQADEPGTGRDFASSLALMVLGASLLSERLNGRGLLAQLELDNRPLVVVVVAALVAGTIWPVPRKMMTATDVVRDVVGRLAFGGLASAVGAELWANKGLLSLLEVETGVGMLSEVEAVLAAAVLLLLTGPRRHAT